MSDIFLSYASADRDFVARLVPVLEAQGWSVWWDRHIVAGQDWENVIEKVLDKSRCVVVVWSKSSVDSPWVRIEAGLGRERAKIAPVLMEDIAIPIAFRQIQTASLVGWDGSESFAALQRLQDGIRRILAGPVATTQTNPIAPISDERALDAALPKEMAVLSSINLVAMIRRLDSPGLKGILSDDDEYDLSPKDVVSKAVTITHPVDGRGRPLPADILIRIISPGFDPPMQEKRIQVSPQRDSTVCAFLLRALETGGLVVQLDLYQRETCVASRIIRTNGLPVGQVSTSVAHNVVSLPLNVNVVERETAPPPMASARESATTAQMQIPESVRSMPSAPMASSSTGNFPTSSAPPMPMSSSPPQAPTASKGLSGSAWAKISVVALMVVLGVPVIVMQMPTFMGTTAHTEAPSIPPPVSASSQQSPISVAPTAPPEPGPIQTMPPPALSPVPSAQVRPTQPMPEMPAPASAANSPDPQAAIKRRALDLQGRIEKVSEALEALIQRQKLLPRGEILGADIEMRTHWNLAMQALAKSETSTATQEMDAAEKSVTFLERVLVP